MARPTHGGDQTLDHLLGDLAGEVRIQGSPGLSRCGSLSAGLLVQFYKLGSYRGEELGQPPRGEDVCVRVRDPAALQLGERDRSLADLQATGALYLHNW